MLIDSHAHLLKEFYGDFLSSEVESSCNGKTIFINNVGFDLESSLESIEIAEKNDNLFVSAGFHSHNIGKMNMNSVIKLKEILKEKKIIAVGEIGLDYYRKTTGHKLQMKKFEEQIYLAKEYNLPIIIHSREAFEDTMSIIKKTAYFNGVFHSFDYGKKEAEKVLDSGMNISFSGMLTFRSRSDLIEVAKYAPIQNILFETDSPFLAPTPMRGKRNHPCFVEYVYKFFAEITNIDLSKLEENIMTNFNRIFKTDLSEREADNV